jgi:hypothetical protein
MAKTAFSGLVIVAHDNNWKPAMNRFMIEFGDRVTGNRMASYTKLGTDSFATRGSSMLVNKSITSDI